MIDVEKLKIQYPIDWLVANMDVIAFLTILATKRLITWDELAEYEQLGPRFLLPDLVLGDMPPTTPTEPKLLELIEQFPELWGESNVDVYAFLDRLGSQGIIDPADVRMYYDDFKYYWDDTRGLVPTDLTFKDRIKETLWEKIRDGVMLSINATMRSLWELIKRSILELGEWIKKNILPPIKQALGQLDSALSDLGVRTYDGLKRLMMDSGPVRPEDAFALAAKVYLFSFGMGIAAHGSATVFELLHPLKSLGLHSISAMISDFAGYGRICSATMGVMTSVALAQPMRYAVNDLARPVIPDDRLLIELRSKREIDKPDFDKAMGYQGFSKHWIDVIERWQWKDPRMFELMRVADIGIEQGPPPASEAWWFKKFGVTGEKLKDWWLYRKLMRAGYEDIDLDVLVRTIHRREISFALTYVRTAIRRNYRWGYLSDKELDTWIDRLMLPEQAKKWIFWAGQLDREYFYRQDLVRLYTTQYRNDIITDDSFLVGLVTMGLPLRDADMTVRVEKARKYPQITQPVVKAAQKVMTKVQTKYVQLYIEQYRKGLITKDALLTSLLAVGIHPELAEVTSQLEEAKKLSPVPPAAAT